MHSAQRRKTLIKTMAFLFIMTLMGTMQFVTLAAWLDDTPLTTDAAWDRWPSVMQTRNGSIWAIWATDRIGMQYDLYYKTSSDYGLFWSDPIRITWHRTNDQDPSIIQLRDKTIWLIWASARTGNHEIYYKTTSAYGSWWSGMVRLTNNTAIDAHPSITQNIDGTIWVIWHRQEDSNNHIHCTSSADYGLSWSNETQLSTSSNYNMHPSITHTENGTLWVTWASWIDGNYEIFYITSSDYGISWSDPFRLTTDISSSDENPSIVQDVGGRIWVFWSKDEEIYYKTTTDYGSNWSLDTKFIASNREDTAPFAVNTNNRTIWVLWESDRISNPDPQYDIFYTISDEITPVHDMAAIDILAWAHVGGAPLTWVPRSLPVYINVTVENQGTYDETFNVTAYAERNTGDVHIDIGTEYNVFLTAGAKTVVTLTWNTTSTPYGTYYISAGVTPVAGEYDITDNLLLNGAKIGGICVLLQHSKVGVPIALVHLAQVILVIIALGIVGISVFKLLMSIKLRWPWLGR